MNNLTFDELKQNMARAKDTTNRHNKWCALTNIIGGIGMHCDCCRMLIGRIKDYEDEVPYGVCGVYTWLESLR